TDSPAGTIIRTKDDVAYVIVPDDTPDHEGKTGVMLLAAPSEGPILVADGRTTWNGFPVYASTVELDDGEEVDVVAEVVDDDQTGTTATPSTTEPTTPAPFDEDELRADLEARGHDELKGIAIELELEVPLNAKAPIVEA